MGKSNLDKEVVELRKENQQLLTKQNQVIELTVSLRQRIEALLNPPQPEHVTMKDACRLLNRTHAIVLGYFKDANIKPVATLGKSKSYAYSDVERVGRILGIRLQKLSA